MIPKTANSDNESVRDSVRLTGHHFAGAPERWNGELDHRGAREHAESLLDEALGETFPASDPIAITFREHDSK